MIKDIIFINSHPIQYFAPLYKYLNKNGIKTKAWYCSDESIRGELDKEFGVDVKWDIPLLEGYDFKFYKNYSLNPSYSTGFFGLVNFGLIGSLFKIPQSIIIVHGWNYFTHFFVIILGRLCGHTICLRNDMPQNHEVLKKEWYQVIKRVGLKYMVFPFVNYFLYIGKQNRKFYKNYQLPDQRLVYCPYAVDNDRFNSEYEKLKPDVENIKKALGIPKHGKVIVFSGKYVAKKRPMDLLKAFEKLNNPLCWLIMVGDGEFRHEIEAFNEKHQLKHVVLTGFINQSQICKYYAIADLFVMCSSFGENWGLSVNEAMNFNLPLLISNLTGCSDDLVQGGNNGIVFETENVTELTKGIEDILFHNKLSWHTPSLDIVRSYSFNTISKGLRLLQLETSRV